MKKRLLSALLSLCMLLIFCAAGCEKKTPAYETLTWPVNDLCAMLPAPKSDKGKVIIAYDHAVAIDVAETSEQDFADYIKLCEEEYGFSERTSHSTKSFVGYTVDGYHLIVQTHSDDVMWINLEVPREEEPPELQDDSSKPITEPDTSMPIETPPDQSLDISTPSAETNPPEETQPMESNSLYYSTNTLEQAKKGNSGVLAYKRNSGNYYIYWIIDLDERYAYYFTYGNGNGICDRIQIDDDGDLNSYITVTYHDGDSSWQEGLCFKRIQQPDRLINSLTDGTQYEFLATDLDEALKIRDSMEIVDY